MSPCRAQQLPIEGISRCCQWPKIVRRPFCPSPHPTKTFGGGSTRTKWQSQVSNVPSRTSQWFACRYHRTCRSSGLFCMSTVCLFQLFKECLPVVVDLPESTCPMTTTLIWFFSLLPKMLAGVLWSCIRSAPFAQASKDEHTPCWRFVKLLESFVGLCKILENFERMLRYHG